MIIIGYTIIDIKNPDKNNISKLCATYWYCVSNSPNADMMKKSIANMGCSIFYF